MKKRAALNFELKNQAPDWIELIPAGETVRGRDGREWKNDHPDGIVEAFLVSGADIPIDIEHATEIKAPEGEPAPAQGWIRQVVKREDGSIWGKVEWTDQGKWAVEGREYRYLSPAFLYNEKTGRILSLESVALTNKPNLRIKALNRQGENEKMDKRICEALGLNPDASAESVLSAINAMDKEKTTALNRVKSPDPDQWVPKADYDLALNRAKKAETQVASAARRGHEDAVETALNQALKDGKIAPSSLDYHRENCATAEGLEKFKTFAAGAPDLTPALNFKQGFGDAGGPVETLTDCV